LGLNSKVNKILNGGNGNTEVTGLRLLKLNIHSFINGSTAPWLGHIFSFVILYTARTPWGISPSQGLSLHTGQHKQNKPTQTSMPRVVFKAVTPAFEQAKTAHALGRATTVTGKIEHYIRKKPYTDEH
jgi:hypothetical protein